MMFCETCCLAVREEHGLRGGAGDQVRKNEIGRACDTFVGYQRCMKVLARNSVRK